MQTTRKTNQVDIDLSSIKDEPTRIALSQILVLVNSMVGTGVDTEGTLKARNGIQSGFADDSGLLMWKMVGRSLPADTGGEDHHDTIMVPGRIYGVIGWSQFNGTNEWRAINRASATTTVYIEQGTGTPRPFENVVAFVNSDPTHANLYHAIIFYQPVEFDRNRGFV